MTKMDTQKIDQLRQIINNLYGLNMALKESPVYKSMADKNLELLKIAKNILESSHESN
jgi:hypothetical protein